MPIERSPESEQRITAEQGVQNGRSYAVENYKDFHERWHAPDN
jgi:hypothetical protein